MKNTEAAVAQMSDPTVVRCLALLDEVLTLLGDDPPLSGADVRRATKMPKGGADLIPKIRALCEQHDVAQVAALTAQEMTDAQSRGDALVQLGLRSALVQKKLKDGAMSAHGRSWQIAMTMYAALARLANDDPNVAEGVEPVAAFFRGKKKVAAGQKAEAQG